MQFLVWSSFRVDVRCMMLDTILFMTLPSELLSLKGTNFSSELIIVITFVQTYAVGSINHQTIHLGIHTSSLCAHLLVILQTTNKYRRREREEDPWHTRHLQGQRSNYVLITLCERTFKVKEHSKSSKKFGVYNFYAMNYHDHISQTRSL